MNNMGKVLIVLCVVSIYCHVQFCIADYRDIEEESADESTTEQVRKSTFQMPDEKWTAAALKDIAYYLRHYKFNGWDQRYHNVKPDPDLVGYFRSFPVPPLKTLHWKVYEKCNNDFYKCITYLHEVIATAPFTRSDDIAIILPQKSHLIENDTIEKLNTECKKALSNSEKTGLPFDDLEEKFQWCTSASYYMCWYTMLGTPALSMLGEPCDNFANCFDPQYGYHNMDIRSDDKLSFFCALYSFCPDPCCPVRHLESVKQCNDHEANPCYAENIIGESSDRQCVMDRKDNQQLQDIIANKWNVSCHCNEEGFIWKSEFGMCVDINECVTGEHDCDNKTEDCFNLPGTFRCICKWDFEYIKELDQCVELNLFKIANTNHKKEHTFLEIIFQVLQYFGIVD